MDTLVVCPQCESVNRVGLLRADRAKFVLAKLNTEACPASGDSFQIKGIPTMLVFKNGVEVARQSGAMPLPALMSYLKQFS